MATTALVFQFTFSGTTYTVAMASGVSGWVLLGQSVVATSDIPIQAAMDYVGALGGGLVFIHNEDYAITAPLIPGHNGITLQGENMHTTILRAPALAVHNIIERTAGPDIYFFTIRDLHIYHNDEATAGNGIHITASLVDLEVTSVRTTACGDGIHIVVWGAKLYHVVSEHCINTGFYVFGSQSQLLNCFAADNDMDGFELGTRNSMSSCYSYGNGRYGMNLQGNDSEVIGGATLGNYLIQAGTKAEIFIAGDRVRVHGVSIDGETTSTYGIRLAATADDCSILGNIITNIITAGIWCQAGTGNLIKDNIGGTIVDDGIDTKLATLEIQFVQGSVFISQDAFAKGWHVDQANEYAVALGQLPLEVQQVVRIKIWAVALDAPLGGGGQMHLEIIFNAGASNAAFNTAAKSWTLTDFDSEEADYVADDVVHWVIEDGDVGNELLNLVAADSAELKVIYEAGAAPDGDTDAVFRVVEVSYV